MKRALRRSHAWAAWLMLASALPATPAQAAESRFGVRSTGSAASMLSSDQIGRLRYDEIGFLGGAHAEYGVRSFLDISLGAAGGAFPASRGNTGGFVAVVPGLLLKRRGSFLTPYAALCAGPALTGSLVRPFFDLSLGLDLAVTRKVSLGPALGYGHLIQWNLPGSSTDARYVWFGITLRGTPHRTVERKVVARPPPPPAVSHEIEVNVTEPAPAQDNEVLALIERTLPTPRTQVELLAPVLFRFDSDELEPIGVAMLHEVVHVLEVRADIELLQIQGYADARGTDDYNRQLSERRAQRVLAWLVEHGVSSERLSVAGQGETSPVESGSSEGSLEQNRRVIFRVLRLREQP
jgi:outer membrane protein OmpA-like peptidoglycan-associated protein